MYKLLTNVHQRKFLMLFAETDDTQVLAFFATLSTVFTDFSNLLEAFCTSGYGFPGAFFGLDIIVMWLATQRDKNKSRINLLRPCLINSSRTVLIRTRSDLTILNHLLLTVITLTRDFGSNFLK